MFNNYEPLICNTCSKEFIGRKPSEGGNILCPDCIDVTILPVINEGGSMPSAVYTEIKGGKGDE